MTRKQLEIRQLEVRAELRTLAGEAELTEEQRAQMAALTTEATQLDERLKALLVAGDGEPPTSEVETGTPEQRELLELRSKANAGDVFAAVHRGGAPEGATRDYQQALGLSASSIPTDLLLEHRASVATPAAAEHAPTALQQQETIPAVFPTMVAEMMGVDRVQVPVGQAAFPIVAAPNTGAEQTTEGTQVGDTTATLNAEALSPARIQMSFSYSVEDAAVYPMLDEVLRSNLAAAIASGLDRQALRLTGQGLLDFGTDPSADGTTETFASYQAAALGRVDGRYANVVGDVRMLMGADTYAQAAGVYRGSQQVQSALEWLMDNLGWAGVSAYVPAQTNDNEQQAVFCRGGMPGAKQPVWPSVDVIRDPYSLSREGEVRLTAVALANFRVVRADQYQRYLFDLS